MFGRKPRLAIDLLLGGEEVKCKNVNDWFNV